MGRAVLLAEGSRGESVLLLLIVLGATHVFWPVAPSSVITPATAGGGGCFLHGVSVASLLPPSSTFMDPVIPLCPSGQSRIISLS